MVPRVYGWTFANGSAASSQSEKRSSAKKHRLQDVDFRRASTPPAFLATCRF